MLVFYLVIKAIGIPKANTSGSSDKEFLELIYELYFIIDSKAKFKYGFDSKDMYYSVERAILCSQLIEKLRI
jgi:hypothetical protein